MQGEVALRRLCFCLIFAVGLSGFGREEFLHKGANFGSEMGVGFGAGAG